MKIIYFSMTNNIERFVQKSEIFATKGQKDMVVSEPFVIIVPTSGFGQIPKDVLSFLSNAINVKNCKYVIGSGNKNWGEFYCKAAHLVAQMCDASILMKFELSGNVHDINNYQKIIKEISNNEREDVFRTKQCC